MPCVSGTELDAGLKNYQAQFLPFSCLQVSGTLAWKPSIKYCAIGAVTKQSTWDVRAVFCSRWGWGKYQEKLPREMQHLDLVLMNEGTISQLENGWW